VYQRVVIVGNLGRDVEMRYTPDGTPVASFSVATEAQKDKTVWWRVSTWRKTAEACNQFLRKGSRVLCEGTVSEPRVWQGRDGEHRASLELTAYTVKFLSSKGDAGATATAEQPAGDEGDEQIPF